MFFFITINGRFKIELQLLLPWWGLQEVSSSPCPEQGLWPYQAPQKVHGEDHDRQLCFQIPRKSINLQPCFQIPRKMVVCIVLHPAWRPVAGFPGGAGTWGFCFSRRGTEGQLCGVTPAVLHLGALHLMSKQHTNCFSSRSWSTAQSSVEFGCLQITLHRAGLGQPCCSSPAWNLPVLGGGGLEPLTCIFHAFSCVKTASSAFIAWYQPKKSHVVSHGDSRRCSVCLFISFDGLGLLALKLFCKLWE